ncbi:MAG: hypothetical protein AB1650_02310 [Candidatus Omnitrophota bacterium]
MKKFLMGLLFVVFLVGSIGYVIAADNGHEEPAPNSGDGIPDGSGFENPNGPGEGGSGDSGKGHQSPAPNAGDGVPDGSGW